MTKEEKDEAYERAYNYDPSEEEIKKKYSEEFRKKWFDNNDNSTKQ